MDDGKHNTRWANPPSLKTPTLHGWPTEKGRMLVPGGCGGEMTFTHEGAFDGEGHKVIMAHALFVSAASTLIEEIAVLHSADVENLIPMCRECGVASPCPTEAAILAKGWTR